MQRPCLARIASAAGSRSRLQALEEGRLETRSPPSSACQDRPARIPTSCARRRRRRRPGRRRGRARQYRALAELRPDDPMPRVCIARHPAPGQGDPEGALDDVEAAFDFIDEEADLIEAVIVRTEALLATRRPARARASRSPSCRPGDRRSRARARPRQSSRWPRKISRSLSVGSRSPQQGDARSRPTRSTCSAAIHEADGRPRRHDRRVAAGPRARRRGYRRAQSRSPRTSSSASRPRRSPSCPTTSATSSSSAPILIDDVPSEDLVADGLDPRMLGLFQGTPMPEDGDRAPTVTNILLFKTNLERVASTSITSPRRSASPCCTRPRTTSASTRTTSRSSASTERSVLGMQSVRADARARHADRDGSSTRPCRCTSCCRCRSAAAAAPPRVGRDRGVGQHARRIVRRRRRVDRTAIRASAACGRRRAHGATPGASAGVAGAVAPPVAHAVRADRQRARDPSNRLPHRRASYPRAARLSTVFVPAVRTC